MNVSPAVLPFCAAGYWWRVWCIGRPTTYPLRCFGCAAHAYPELLTLILCCAGPPLLVAGLVHGLPSKLPPSQSWVLVSSEAMVHAKLTAGQQMMVRQTQGGKWSHGVAGRHQREIPNLAKGGEGVAGSHHSR